MNVKVWGVLQGGKGRKEGRERGKGMVEVWWKKGNGKE